VTLLNIPSHYIFLSIIFCKSTDVGYMMHIGTKTTLAGFHHHTICNLTVAYSSISPTCCLSSERYT